MRECVVVATYAVNVIGSAAVEMRGVYISSGTQAVSALIRVFLDAMFSGDLIDLPNI